MFSWIPGESRVTFTHSKDSVVVHQQSGKSTLAEICKKSTPPCHLNPLLFNGHLQTMWTATKETDIPIYYKRRVFQASESDYTGQFAVDFAVPPYNAARDPSLPDRTAHFTSEEFDALGGDDEKPMLFLLHGLSGGSYEVYLRAVLKPIIDAGWEACVINSRGCAMSTITSNVLYNARATWDIRQIVQWAREKWPRRRFFGIGFSLGANIITNYVAEEGENCLLEAVVVCSNPWNLEVASMALRRSRFGMEVYSKTMGGNLIKLFETHKEQISRNPRIDADAIRKIKYLHEFDREVQCPTWGYPTVEAYYRDASSSDALMAVRIPLFAINSEDDPIAHVEAFPWDEFKQNPYTVLCSTSLGGHLSWFEVGGNRWFAKPAANFLMAMAEDSTIVEKPTKVLSSPSAADLGISATPPLFQPMRRKLKMAMDI